MKVESFIATRYLLTHRRSRFLSFITTFAILGVTLGTAALIITLSVLDGFEREITEKVVGFTSHIQIQGFQNKLLGGYRESMERVKRIVPAVRDIAPFVAREGMIRKNESVDGVYLKGIDPSNDLSFARRYLVGGTYLTEEGSPLVVGRKLADRMDLHPGDRVILFGLPRPETGTIQARARQFTVTGIYESGMAEYDDIYAYTTLSQAQALFQTGDRITGFDVLVNDVTRVDTVALALQEVLGYPHFARTVFQLYRNLFSWVDLQKQLSPVLLALIIVVALVNIIGTLLMYVLEKTADIGILKTLGAAPSVIRKIFVIQGMSIGAIGIVLGNTLGFLLCWIQAEFRVLSLPADIYYMDTVPILLRPENFLIVTAVALILCYVTTLLPSRAAARSHVVSALRFG